MLTVLVDMAEKGSVQTGIFGGSLTFDHRVQEWSIFKSRFTQFCAANNIVQDNDKLGMRRRALLLTALVEDTYRVARDLVFPKLVEEVEYESLLSSLDTHFKSKRSSFGERLKFSLAQQRPGEELTEWAARVRSLAQYCGFKTELDMSLRDRFVLGLEPSKEKEKLFAENIETLTFDKALEIAQSVRCARMALHSTRHGATATASSTTFQPVFALHRGGGGGGTDSAVSSRAGNGGGGGGGGAGSARYAQNIGSNNYSSKQQRCEVCGYKNYSKEKCRYVD